MFRLLRGGQRRYFSSALDITVVDTASLLSGGKVNMEECRKVVQSFHKHGVVAIRDPRVDENKNQDFINLMTRYFETQSEKYYRGEALEDAKPQYGYQVGVTPELVERAREHSETIKNNFTKFPVSDYLNAASNSSTSSKGRQMEIFLENRRDRCQG
jgi:hypothetical protein